MEALRFALLGLATGAIYALLAVGLVLVYRGSGLLNFAQGAIAMFGAYAYYELTVRLDVPKWPSMAVTVLLCAALGAIIHLVVLRAMRRRNASPLARVIATLSVLLILQSAALLIYGSYPLQVPSLLPTRTVTLFSDQLSLTVDRLWILGICLALSALLYAVYRWSSFGRVTAAVAENELAAASFGYSPDTVAAANWAIGSVLAGVAGVLIAPILFLQPNTLVLLIVPAMAAALVGGFSSFPIVLGAALALGVAQSEISRYVGGTGWATAAPFIAVIAFLAVRGRGLPLRSFVLDRPPTVGTGKVRPAVVLVIWGVGSWLILGAGAEWDASLVTTFGTAIVCLSIVLLTGYTGQLSLAQFVIAGVGALVAAKLIAHMALIPAVVLATLATGAIGAVIGLPALRTRGATLAVATLCLGSAVVAAVFSNTAWTGGLSGIVLPQLSLLGWSIDPVVHPDRYAFVTFTVLIAIAVAVANLRRGVTGRQLLAVRSNERAAASLGVPVAGVKAYAFFVAAVVAAIGGILLAFVQPTVQVTQFDVFTCVLLVGLTVIGGIGYVPGGIFAGLLIAGGVFTQVFSGWSSINDYLPLVGAVGLTLTLMTGPDGWFAGVRASAARLVAAMDRVRLLGPLPVRGRGGPPPIDTVRVPAQTLRVEGVCVRFGGVRAVQDVSIEVRPGEIHGLIGPNGAGKTTLIDAITGFAKTSSGAVRLGEEDVSRWGPRRRAMHGLARSFQSLELFDDLTVEENLAVASRHGARLARVTDLVAPGRVHLSPAAHAAVRSFQLEHLLSVQPTSISFGQRKIVAIARSVASTPSTLLLDEPAAGLDDTEADELATLIRRLADEWGIGILLVEHKVDLIMSISDRITVLDGGRVLASGTPDEVQATPEVLDAYLGAVAA
jgi:sulfate-transporting ATPase